MTRTLLTLISSAFLAGACGQNTSSTSQVSERRNVPQQSAPPAEAQEPPRAAAPQSAAPEPEYRPPHACHLKLGHAGRHTWRVGAELINRSDSSFVVRYHHPLIFNATVKVGPGAGAPRPIPLSIPPFDGPVEEREVTVPPQDRVTLDSAVTLRFAPDEQPPSRSPFDWLMLSEPVSFSVSVERPFLAPSELFCVGHGVTMQRR